MLKFIKAKLNSFIDNRIKLIVDEVIRFSNNRYGIKFQDDTSVVYKPYGLDGGQYITIGSNSRIGKYAWLGAFDSYLKQSFSPSIKIGNNVSIGNFSCITAVDKVIISDGCLFSEYVYISDHYHGYDASEGLSPAIQPLYSKGPVFIGENTFIGIRASILPGVNIGKHCVVGAHSVVSKSVPDYTMVAGAPARIVKKYDLKKKEWIPVFGL